ncbi:GNAT family N-acetyltransferase [Actinomyces sp. 2119]|uniref:GNAT family N-acetyltransferase n=1 Tax=Actinomyces lilanjuaniae TaxID=2321394 RepID=A0ABN5PP84_9ACTO|nr:MULTISPECIES: GNAT family N-acetyltransferase [Actinomyces]AYD88907.1 GNAT family N-acetyltransferase [Actinomyces lilanjuaniae]RJF43772.1 GNAT family N-acetyltransferase [Actinomyces sp. 2119]
MCQTVRELTRADMTSEMMLSLVREAVGQPETQVRCIITEELPTMVVLGAGPQGRPTSLAACAVHPDHVGLEYLAVADGLRGLRGLRGNGLGRLLLTAVARLGFCVIAETDDDAVGFYRRLGFRVTTAPEDPRWPGATRYRCVLDTAAASCAL